MRTIIYLIAISFSLLSTETLAQKTYFIKYKSSVPIDLVESNVSQQRLSNNLGDAPLALPDYNVNYLAKGLGRGDEVLGRIVKIQFSQDVDASNLSAIISNDPEIEYLQEANVYKVDAITPNDSLLSDQWALEKINAFDAWEITQGADSVLLAIIDTGIEYFHPDLKNKIYINPGESGLKSNNGIDDDNNGFVDDYMGWDFVDRAGFPADTNAGDFLNWDNDPYDLISGYNGFHGTFVGGIAGAETNNISGIAGIAPNIKLLNIRALDNGGNGEEDDAAAAILYAVKIGAKVINMSWGDYKFSYVLRDVIRYAYSQNAVLVGSSGNATNQITLKTPHYPSGYDEVISVGNSTQSDYRSSNSVYGSTLDLMAPGTEILSTSIGSDYYTTGGTSASAPLVAGTAALILSLNNFTNEEVKQILKSTTDDIGEPGWDEQHGAGRLNMERALRVLAPSNIKINFPTMDYGTFSDTLIINASILSAYFVNYSLEVGEGYLPEDWTPLIENGLNQFEDENIFTLNLHNYPEGSYVIRLLVNTNDGRTTEERVMFHIMRTPPKVTEWGLGSIYYGDRSTIQGEFETNQPCIMKMYYRKFGESNFNYVSLDGFATNNQFVKQYHYGFIPKDIISPSTSYDVYFEAENLAGLKTFVMDSSNGINYFNIITDDVPKLTSYNEMPFTLPNGVLFGEPVSFLSDSKNEVLFETYYPSSNFIFSNFRLAADSLVRYEVDSLFNRFPKFYGDFNNNGLKDLFVANGADVSVEQTTQNSFSFIKKDSTKNLYLSLLVDDLRNDGNYYMITENFPDKKPSRYLLWKINSDLTTTFKDTIYISHNDLNGSHYTSEQIAIDDIDSDGNKELWFLDSGANLKSYVVNSNLSFSKADSFYTGGLSLTDYSDNLKFGNYDGTGNKDIAILYRTNSIAPTFLLLIITFENNQPKIISENVFLDQSEEYSGGITINKFYTSLKFVDIDTDGLDELVLNIFPFTYIFKYENGKDEIVFYRDNSNTEHIFVGDLNQNGVPEIALNLNEQFKFFEFSNSNRTSIPSLVKGFSIDSTSVQVSWVSDAPIFYFYKGTSANNLDSLGLVTNHSYYDNSVNNGQKYYYGVKAYDPSKPEPLSGMSSVIEVYAHTPGKPINAFSNSNRSVIVTFSEKMRNTIDNLQAFKIIDSTSIIYPNSITAYNQYSYLLSYSNDLPQGQRSIIISDLKDLYGSPIETDTLTFDVSPVIQSETFFITSSGIINSYKIKLTFNYPVEQVLALNVNNYLFEPENKVSSVTIDQNDPKTIYLDLTGNKPIGAIGKEYVLRISNLTSSNGITINSGAGSYVVLSTYAKDLSDVYVYPNPSKEGSEKVTFANLPQRAKITIWTVDGKMINEIEESDGNGGVDYDLTDFDGKNISSGIYIFRIVMLDDQNNEGEEKLGKFAVVR